MKTRVVSLLLSVLVLALAASIVHADFNLRGGFELVEPDLDQDGEPIEQETTSSPTPAGSVELIYTQPPVATTPPPDVEVVIEPSQLDEAIEVFKAFPERVQNLIVLLGKDLPKLFETRATPLTEEEIRTILSSFSVEEIETLLKLHKNHPEVFQIVGKPFPSYANLSAETLKAIFEGLTDDQQISIVGALHGDFAGMLEDNKIDDKEIETLFTNMNENNIEAIKEFLKNHPGLIPTPDVHIQTQGTGTGNFSIEQVRDFFFSIPEEKQIEFLLKYGPKLQEMVADDVITIEEAQQILDMFSPEDLEYIHNLVAEHSDEFEADSLRAFAQAAAALDKPTKKPNKTATTNSTTAAPTKSIRTAGSTKAPVAGNKGKKPTKAPSKLKKLTPKQVRDMYFNLSEEQQVEFLANYGDKLKALVQDGSLTLKEAKEILSFFSKDDLKHIKQLILAHPEAFTTTSSLRATQGTINEELRMKLAAAFVMLSEAKQIEMFTKLGGAYKHFVVDGRITGQEIRDAFERMTQEDLNSLLVYMIMDNPTLAMVMGTLH